LILQVSTRYNNEIREFIGLDFFKGFLKAARINLHGFRKTFPIGILRAVVDDYRIKTSQRCNFRNILRNVSGSKNVGGGRSKNGFDKDFHFASANKTSFQIRSIGEIE